MAGGAAFAAVAPAAYAAPSATSYHSTATSSSGNVTIGDQKLQLEKTAAYPGNSPKSASIGTAQLIPVLQGVPGIGPALARAVQTANPSGTDVVTVSAYANSDGNSGACAAVLAANCANNASSHPLKINLGLADLGITSLTGALSSVTGVSLQITLNGPTATCTESANGHGTANDTPLDATAELVDSTGKAVSQPVQLHGGDILGQLGGLGLPATATTSLGLIVSGGSKHVGSGTSTATALEVGLTAGGSTLLDVKGATVTCGPNGTSGGGGGTGGGGGNGGGGAGTGGGGGVTPITSIGTDEGRSTAAAEPWAALNGMP